MTRRVAIIGAGPAGLMAAEAAAGAGARVTIHDHKPSAARKFLMAGRGGLNLTHSEARERFLGRYGEAREHLTPLIDAFPPRALRAWADGLGARTFVGSSGRVFPRAMKASPLLRAWMGRLASQGVAIETRARWAGWQGDTPFLSDGRMIDSDALVLAMGGTSWSSLGSDGAWTAPLSARGVALSPFRPANVGFEVPWSETMRTRFAGAPLKNIALETSGRRARGEAIITAYGLEGGVIYALSAALRDGDGHLTIDLCPDTGLEVLKERLGRSTGKQSLSNRLRKAARLSPAGIALLREAAGALPTDPAALAALIRAVPLRTSGPRGLDRAISSAGGVCWRGVGARLELAALPGVYVAGEMLDWEAPTGGYLLQACLATGRAAGLAAAGAPPDAPQPWS